MQRIRGASKHLQQAIEAISKAEIKVGFFAHSQHETDKGAVPTASIAAVQELGSIKRGIPARPFLNPALEERRDENVRLMLDAAKDALNGGDISASFDKIGGKLVGDVQTKITEITQPPLSNLTLLLRQHRKSGEEVTGKTVGNASRALVFLPSEGVAESLGVSDKPLVDTGQMLRAVTFEVVE
jgi:hypothetical protein